MISPQAVKNFPRASATEPPNATPMNWPRALQTLTHTNSTSQSSTSSTRSATSARPFFQDPHSVTPSPSPPPDPGHSVSKVVLEYVLIAAFVMICAGLLLHRIINRRRNNAATWPTLHSPSPATGSPSVPYRFPRTTGFTEVPPYPYARRTRALDTDAAGRRVGGGIEESDHDGFIGDKDVLPAYDNAGGPPKYRELALELSVMPPHTPGNDTGNTGDAGTREPEAETRSSHQFTDSDQENGDIPGEPETLSVPNAVHVRQ